MEPNVGQKSVFLTVLSMAMDSPWPWTVHGHGQSIWETYNLLFDVILRLSEALVCFRASGDNFLRSITRAIVNKNDGKRKIDFLTSF